MQASRGLRVIEEMLLRIRKCSTAAQPRARGESGTEVVGVVVDILRLGFSA